MDTKFNINNVRFNLDSWVMFPSPFKNTHNLSNTFISEEFFPSFLPSFLPSPPFLVLKKEQYTRI